MKNKVNVLIILVFSLFTLNCGNLRFSGQEQSDLKDNDSWCRQQFRCSISGSPFFNRFEGKCICNNPEPQSFKCVKQNILENTWLQKGYSRPNYGGRVLGTRICNDDFCSQCSVFRPNSEKNIAIPRVAGHNPPI